MEKFLLCEQIFEDNKGLNNHYKIYVEEDNFFYKDLFVEKKDKGFILSLWPRCDQFLESARERKIHNFIRYYVDGKSLPFKNKPVIVSRFVGLVVYIITYEAYKNFCNYFDSVDVIKKLFNVFKQRFVPFGKKVQIKFNFSIINFQLPPAEGLIEPIDSRT